MKKVSAGLSFCSLILFTTLSCNNSQTLFQETANDWKVYGDAKWNFSNNILQGEVIDRAGFVMTEQSYKDFELQLEFKPDSTINSGVFIRCTKKEINPVDCHELNIWDLHPNQDYRTGAIVTKAVPKVSVETIGQWNSYRILADKNQIKVWVNEIKTADSGFKYPLDGYIALQAMGTGKIEFRNIRIKTLD